MKIYGYIKWILAIYFVVLPVVSSAEDKSDEPLSYSISATQFTFQPVVDGAEIIHDFFIQNKGTEILSILNVKTG